MTVVQITGLTGGTVPIDVFVADYYGNNKVYVGQIIDPLVPPTISYYPTSIFDTSPIIMIILIDSNGCEVMKLIDCSSIIPCDLIAFTFTTLFM
jgi:hypothetical protein